jgi:hypothetical protein
MSGTSRTIAPDLAAAQAEIARLTAELATAQAKTTPRTAQTPLANDRAAWVASHARPAVAKCLCGCDGETKGRFVPGHDAVLKSRLAATIATDTPEAWDALAALQTFGW